MSLEIGTIPEPEASEHWEALQAFLRPAAERAGLGHLIGEDELLWAVLAQNRAIAAATVRLTADDVMEVVLMGGVNHRLWLKELEDAIAACARANGARKLRAYGRRGWKRAGWWREVGEKGGWTLFERDLENA